MENQILAGFSKKIITPGRPVLRAGQFYRRLSKSVEHDIYSVAMAIKSADNYFIICSCDLNAIDAPLGELVKNEITRRAPGIDTSKVILLLNIRKIDRFFYTLFDFLFFWISKSIKKSCFLKSAFIQ